MAILGDKGIHEKVGDEFWKKEISKMVSEFNRDHYAEGIAKVVRDIGEVLKVNFPYKGETDKNELPDDIIFGR